MIPPELTPLQFSVIGRLFSGPRTGWQLRHQIGGPGKPMSTASFSKLMRRMEMSAYVDVDRSGKRAPASGIRESVYQVTDLGVIAWKATRKHYADAPPPPPDLEMVATEEARYARHPPHKRKAILGTNMRRRVFRALTRALSRDPQH